MRIKKQKKNQWRRRKAGVGGEFVGVQNTCLSDYGVGVIHTCEARWGRGGRLMEVAMGG